MTATNVLTSCSGERQEGCVSECRELVDVRGHEEVRGQEGVHVHVHVRGYEDVRVSVYVHAPVCEAAVHRPRAMADPQSSGGATPTPLRNRSAEES